MFYFSFWFPKFSLGNDHHGQTFEGQPSIGFGYLSIVNNNSWRAGLCLCVCVLLFNCSMLGRLIRGGMAQFWRNGARESEAQGGRMRGSPPYLTIISITSCSHTSSHESSQFNINCLVAHTSNISSSKFLSKYFFDIRQYLIFLQWNVNC